MSRVKGMGNENWRDKDKQTFAVIFFSKFPQ